MAVCSTTALRKYLTQHSNLGQPLREKASSTTGGYAKGETIRNSGRYRRPLFKSSMTEPPNLILIATLDEEREGWHEGEGMLHDAPRAQSGLPADGEAGASDRAF